MQQPHEPLDQSDDLPDDADELKLRLQRLEDAIASLQNTTEIEERIVQRIGHSTTEPNANAGSSVTKVLTKPPLKTTDTHKPDRLPWLFFDVLAELRATIRMFFDLNYRVAWSTRVIAIGLLILVFTSGWWFAFAAIPFVGTLLDKLVCVALMYVAFKALNREARRYMEWRRQL